MRHLVCVVIVALAASEAYAVGKINRYSSLSSDYCRNVNRYASTGLDAAYYNPAGLVFGREGLGLKILNQSTLIYGQFSITDEDALALGGADGIAKYNRTEEAWDMLWASPMAMAVYNTGTWALYAAVGVVGGGGVGLKGDHPILLENSDYVLENINAKVREALGQPGDFYSDLDFDKSMFEAATVLGALMLGGAYRVADWLSVGGHGKYVYGFGSMELRTKFKVFQEQLGWGPALDGTDEIELEGSTEGHGWAWTVSAHLNPLEELSIALKYESLTEVEMTTTATVDTAGILTGEATRSDIPGQLTLGIDYRITPRWSAQGSFAYFMNEQAQVGELLGYDPSSELEGGWEFGVGTEYIINEDLLVSAGYLYLRPGYRQKTRTASRFINEGHMVGVGGVYRFSQEVDMILGLLAMIDEPGMNRKNDIELRVDMYVASLGFNFWF